LSAFYEVFGTIRFRKCPEAEAVIARLQEHDAGDIEIDVSEDDSGVLSVSIEGGGSFAAAGVLDFDQLLQSLGAYTMEPAILATTYDGEDGKLVVAGTEQAAREELSRHRLDQIDVLLREVTPEDRVKLAHGLRAR
jgi:hypothetical protein